MSASDWDMGTQNNVNPSIVTDGDEVLQLDMNPGAGAVKVFDMFYNGDLSILHTEIDFEKKIVSENLNDYVLPIWLRCNGIDVSTLTGIVFYWRKYFSFPNWYRRVSIYKYDGGTPTLLYASPSNIIQWNLNFWRRLRVRVWDTIFPAGVVRYSIEYWTGAVWSLLLQWDDTSGWRKGVSGRFGIGVRGGTGVISQILRLNNLDLGEETP